MGLFDRQEAENLKRAMPLAARMRPRTIDEFVGQEHFLGPGKLLRRMLEADRISSAIFYGPPGTGKTSLAEVIARQTRRDFAPLNAASAGVKELRAALDEARDRLAADGRRTTLFVDELHRFNRTQQEVMLPDVEAGVVALIGATTANPFFSLVSPLVSRSQVFEFQALSKADVRRLLERALTDRERGLGCDPGRVTEEALDFLAEVSDGDARRALNALEVAVLSTAEMVEPSISWWPRIRFKRRRSNTTPRATSISTRPARSSKACEAAIPMRPSTGWHACSRRGEDPRFLARRIVIAAAEDVGNADPMALVVANSAAQATEMVGMPECRIILSQAVIYVAMAPKSNASYKAVEGALSDVRERRVLPVPTHLARRKLRGCQATGPRAGISIRPRLARGLGRSGLPWRRSRVLSARRSRTRD